MKPQTPSVTSQRRKAGLAAFVGTTVEWYDFYIYSTAAALVFGPLFFPTDDPLVGVAAAFATYAIGYFARPAGAVVFGQLGDKLGRKPALVATMVLMGVATVLTGFLPTFETAGPIAPVMLVVLRFIQGVAVGGEWGGAVLIAVEHAPEKSKTLFGSFPQLGNPTGAMLATGVFAWISSYGDEALMNWGWRLPFIFSAVLIVIGFIIRSRVEESPAFVATQTIRVEQPTIQRKGVLHHWRGILLGMGLVAVPSGAYYISSTYFTSYATGEGVGIDTTLVLQILTIGSFCELIATVPIAWLGDKLGRVKVFVFSCAALGLLGIPLFLFTAEANVPGVLIAMIVIRLAGSGAYSTLAAIMSQAFPTESRYLSMSLSYQVGAAVFGGLSPLVATLLFGVTGTIWSVILLGLAFCVVSIVCSARLPQYVDSEESGVPEEIGA